MCFYLTTTNFPFPWHETFQNFLILLELTKKHFPCRQNEISYSFLIKLSLLLGHKIYQSCLIKFFFSPRDNSHLTRFPFRGYEVS